MEKSTDYKSGWLGRWIAARHMALAGYITKIIMITKRKILVDLAVIPHLLQKQNAVFVCRIELRKCWFLVVTKLVASRALRC